MKPAPNTRQPRSGLHARGVTLVESMVGTAVVVIIAGAAVPGMSGLKSRHALIGAATEFETDVQHTHSLAVAGNATLRNTFDARDGASCYIVHRGPASDCECGPAGEAVCRNGAEAQRRVRFPAGGTVALNANVRSIVFDPVMGTSTPTGTVRSTEPSGAAVHQVINILGRVRSCALGKTAPGHNAC